jgi:hypothetical protein
VAAHGVARDADEVSPVPRRPHVPGRWARRHAHERLGIEADEIDSGHYISLSRPRELAQRLHAYAAAIQ